MVGLTADIRGPVIAEDAPPSARSVEHEFTGISDERSFDVALREALRQMDEAVARHGKYPCTAAKWRVVEIGGETGGPAAVNTLEVRIAARFETKAGDPVGTWRVTRSSGEETMAGFTLTLRRDGEQLSGDVQWPDGTRSEIGAVSERDGLIRFRVVPGSVAQDYSGRMLGDTITGKWAAGIGVFDWKAARDVTHRDVDPPAPAS
jgi:hypothetical protein